MQVFFTSDSVCEFFSTCVNAWQIDFKGGPSSNFTVNPNVSSRLFDYAVDRGEPQSCPFVNFLCREKRFEDMRTSFFVYSGSGVGHCQHHVWSWNDGDMLTGIFRIQVNVPGLDSQATS